jgi:hypothetical protein
MDTTWCVSVSKTGKVEQTLIVIHVPLHLQNMNVFNIDSVSDIMQGSQNVPPTDDLAGYFWLTAVYKFVKNKNRSW